VDNAAGATAMVDIRFGWPRRARLAVLDQLYRDTTLEPVERTWVATFRALASLHAWRVLPGGGGVMIGGNESADRRMFVVDCATLNDQAHQDASTTDSLWLHYTMAKSILYFPQ
jgi:hypothetical protein